MQKQVLSVVIPLATILFSALPSLANTTESPISKVGNLQSVVAKPEFAAPVTNNQLIHLGGANESPGPTGIKPGKGPGPNPPRRDPLLQLGTGLQNTVNSSPVNLNIENPVLDH
ncbi:hypothetical protein I8748_33690 [Nostoc sp. CENA67]|uniref:Uncharacterized protein n=1 Tax=Amazonocrinis nigriterrae CENA67 TaxID=2794033 RepID=A0A8J7LD26_9NOST|nr:hypothetical protein [Amazonocrinis nigriterrae]MBH8567046.1 hypothetical protein [Amazonocrinis nigriterrae CENA67]